MQHQCSITGVSDCVHVMACDYHRAISTFLEQLVMTLSCHYGTQMLKLPKTVKQMKMRDFVAKYGSDIQDVSRFSAHTLNMHAPADPRSDYR